MRQRLRKRESTCAMSSSGLNPHSLGTRRPACLPASQLGRWPAGQAGQAGQARHWGGAGQGGVFAAERAIVWEWRAGARQRGPSERVHEEHRQLRVAVGDVRAVGHAAVLRQLRNHLRGRGKRTRSVRVSASEQWAQRWAVCFASSLPLLPPPHPPPFPAHAPCRA